MVEMIGKKQTPVPWNTDTEYAIGFYRTYIKLLGIWPLDRDTIFPTLMFALFITIQTSVIVTYITKLITIGYCGRMLDAVEIVSLGSLSFGALCKVIIPWKYLDKMYFVINSVAEDWSRDYDKKSYKIMIDYAYKGRAVCLFQLIITGTLILRSILMKTPKTFEVISASDNISTLFRMPPYGPACWISMDMSVHYYHAWYLLVCIHWLSASLAYIGNDVYIFGLGMHMCGQFELLHDELEGITVNDDYKKQREKLIKFIKRHNHLLKVADTIEEIFNLGVLIEVLVNTFVISISGIVLLIAIRQRNRAMGIPKFIRIYLFFVEMFMISYVGEKLSARVDKLQEAIYNVPWYEVSGDVTKDILFIMMRVHYPFHLSAGKILNMNYETYKNIIKSTFSYFSVLRLMMDG